MATPTTASSLLGWWGPLALLVATVGAAFVPQPIYLHGLKYPYSNPDNLGGARAWLKPVISCTNPEHVAVLESYEKHFDADLQKEAWHYADGISEADKRRYTFTRMMVTGSEGTVYEAVDRTTGKLVAIKKVTEVYKSIHGASGQGLHMTAFQVWAEVKALKLTKESPDIMRLNRFIMGKKTAYIVLEMLETTVPPGQHVRSGDIATSLGAPTLQRRVFQFIRGVAFLHSANLVHRDLRWHNVMLGDKCNVVIIDLGNVSPAQPMPRHALISELPLGHEDRRSHQKDIWLAGATILSWIAGIEVHHLVNQGTLTAAGIVEVFGMPPPEVLSMYSKEIQGAFKAAKPKAASAMNWRKSFPSVDVQLFDLIKKMMSLDRKVGSAVELLKHPYLRELHAKEPLAKGPGDMSAGFKRAEAAILGDAGAARAYLNAEADSHA